MEFTNFTLRLFGSDDRQAPHRFAVEATRGGDERKHGPVPVRYHPREIQPLLRKLEKPHAHGALKNRELIELGERLGRMLLPSGVRETLLESMAEGVALRVSLKIDDHRLTSLPWEYVHLQELGGFLAHDPRISIARLAHHDPHESSVGSRAPATLRGNLNVVFGFAEPDDVGEDIDQVSALLALYLARRSRSLGRLDAGFIHRLTRDKLERLDSASDLDSLIGLIDPETRGGFWEDSESEMEMVRCVDALAEVTHLEEVLQAAEAVVEKISGWTATSIPDDVHVFDFSGHGGLFPKQGVDEHGKLISPPVRHGDGSRHRSMEFERGVKYHLSQQERRDLAVEGMMVLEDGEGNHRIVWADEAAGKLKARGVQVVVLNCCQSGKRSAGPIFQWSGLAARLLRAGIPAVVGMQQNISDHAAISFSFGFYSALAQRLPLDEAVARGRAEILKLERWGAVSKDRRRDSQDWGVPVLYLGTPDGVAFE